MLFTAPWHTTCGAAWAQAQCPTVTAQLAPSHAPKPAPVLRAQQRIQVRRFAGHRAHVGTLNHLRVVHLTDQHVGRVTPWAVQVAAVELANQAQPDLVVITGDFVCHSQAYLDQLEALMRMIRAPVMGVLGNHDHWSGAQEVMRALERGGVEVLNNVNTVITLRQQRLQVVGLDDAYTGHANRAAAVRGLNRALPTLGLSHIAEEADGLWHHGVPLVLSGHTHAGQVTLARLHEIALGKMVGHKYVHGLYGCREEERAPGAVYVGAGIGAALVPLRLGERGQREVTVFELGLEPGAVDEHHQEQTPLKGRKPSERVKQRRARAVHKKALRREKIKV